METALFFDEEDIIIFIQNITLFDWESCSLKFFITVIENLNLKEHSIQEKMDAYYKVWNNTLRNLYEKYLPNKKYNEHIGIEFTPFTFYLSTISNVDFVKTLNLIEDDTIILKTKLEEKIALYQNLNVSNVDKANLMLGIMLFPPISKINMLYEKTYKLYSEYTKKIFGIVTNQTIEIPPYQTNFGMKFAHVFFSQDTYIKYGKMDGLISDKNLNLIQDRLIKIKEECANEKKLDNKTICSHCGQIHNIIVKKDDIFYAHLVCLHPDLLIPIGFNYYDDYLEDISNEFQKIIEQLPESINEVRDAKCIILVEGATEELAIPAMAIKYGKPLANRKIHVWNSKSKQKVNMDFMKIKDNLPDVKIVALIDSDAKKEKDELERLTKGKRNKYSYKYIDEGTFEDLIPLNVSLAAINELYDLQPPLQLCDIDNSKAVVKQFEKLLNNLHAGNFDKVKFINKVISLMRPDEVPSLIKELIDDAYDFTEK
jgi:hypothetical protein